MKTPRYRVGQAVNVMSSHFGDQFDKQFFVPCKILYPDECGNYLVQVNQTGGYCMVPEEDISAYPEYDPEKPVDRKNIRIVFFGNGHFAVPILKMLVKRGYDVAVVVTMWNKPHGRGNKRKPSPVKVFADSARIIVSQQEDLNNKFFLQDMRRWNPTLGVVVEYGILPPELFNIPKWGVINLHSSLLPMYRGASTITSAIKDGSAMTGVTTFLIDKGLDTGKIINNLGVYIDTKDSAEDIHVKLCQYGAEMMDDAIQRIAHSCSGVPQADIICDFIQPSHAPKLYRKDAFIPWCNSAETVYNFIRAHSSILEGKYFPNSPAIAGSVPTAWTSLKMLESDSTTDVKIHKTRLTDIPRGLRAPGEWFWDNGKLMVACQDKLLSIEVLQLPGKKPVTAKEYYNGLRCDCRGFCELLFTNHNY